MSNKAGVKDMRQTTQDGLKPRLRFPEFRERWITQILDEIASIINEKAGDNKYILMSIDSGVGLVTQIEKFGREIAGEQYKNYFVIRKNNFAYNKSATKEYPEGFIAMYSGTVAAAVPNSIFICFKVQPDRIIPKYLSYQFLDNLHGRWLRQYITVGARAHGALNIDNNDLLSLPIPIPEGKTSLKEQQKIADCLSSIDELITAQSNKLDRLKTHKKGLMQQLFPAEGESVPKLRFSEFRDAPEWGKCELGTKIVKVGSGITPKGGSVNYTDKGRPFIRSQNVGWGELILDDVAFINDEMHKTFVSTEINADDVLLNITGASIGRSVVADSKIHGGNVNQHVCIIRLKIDEMNSKFLNQYLLSQYGQRQIDNFQAGGNRQGLNFFQVRSFSIPLPQKIEEQIKIANCLSSLDELIAVQTQKLDDLKAHKKGLMQQLFPAIDEEKR